MIEKASDPGLKAAFEQHLRETQSQIGRLEDVFSVIGKPAKGVDCEAIDGILKEAKHVAGNIADPQVLDAALLSSAQAVEHYEITRYGTLIAWAKQRGFQRAVPSLETTLAEEKATDQKLTGLAESRLNRKAA